MTSDPMQPEAGQLDSQVIRRVLGGDPDAFEELVRRYINAIHGMCFAATGDQGEAEDLAQDVFLKAYLSLDKLRESRKFAPWLYAIARNHIRSTLRARQTTKRAAQPFGEVAAIPDIVGEELRQLVRSQIEQLEEPARDALVLFYFGNHSIREVAEMLDISKDAAAKRIQRARETLSERILDVIDQRTKETRPPEDRIRDIMGAVSLVTPTWGSSPVVHGQARGILEVINGVAATKPGVLTVVVVLVGVPVLAYLGLQRHVPADVEPAAEQVAATPAVGGVAKTGTAIAAPIDPAANSTPVTAPASADAPITTSDRGTSRVRMVKRTVAPSVTFPFDEVKSEPSYERDEKLEEPSEEDWHELSSDDLRETVGRHFWSGFFGKLEDFSHWARQEQATTSTGEWKLSIFYDTLDDDYRRTLESDRRMFKQQIGQWIKLFPESITPRVVLLNAIIVDAWDERGSGWAHTVSKEQWEGFDKHLDLGRSVAERAIATGQFDPELNAVLIVLHMAATGDRDEALRLFEEGVAHAPTYRRLYSRMVMFLLPRWHGRPGDLSALAKRAADLTRLTCGDAMYFYVAWRTVWWEGPDSLRSEGFDLARILGDYERFKQIFGWREGEHNFVAYVACRADERGIARREFSEIADRYGYWFWNRHAYAAYKAWASGSGPLPARTPLHEAVSKGDVAAVRAEIDRGADLNAVDTEGNLPLAMACEKHNWEIVRQLLEAGADPDACGTDDTPAFFHAIFHGTRDIFDLFMASGADVDLVAGSGEGALHRACDISDLEAIRYLLEECGANPNIARGRWHPPIVIAAKTAQTEIVKYLLDHGAEPDLGLPGEWNALDWATRLGLTDVVALLIDAGADVLRPGYKGWTPVHSAIGWKQREIFKMFAKSKTWNVNARMPDGRTPLFVAIQNADRELVEFLLNQPDCDLSIPMTDYGPPLTVACSVGGSVFTRMLLERGADVHVRGFKSTPIVAAAYELNLASVKLLLEYGVHPDDAGTAGVTALTAACDVGNMQLVEMLLEAGADANHREPDGWCALHMAVLAGNLDVVKRLWLVPGIDRNPVTDEGRTLMHSAARGGHVDIAEFLLENGFDVNVPNPTNGRTPLDYAVERRKEAMVTFLTERGGVAGAPGLTTPP